jgi:hypothetical protein
VEQSARERIAREINSFLLENDLCQVYGGDVSLLQNNGKTFYELSFSKRATLDGFIQVYGSQFIRVSFKTLFRFLPARSNAVFRSKQTALEFLKAAFVDLDEEKALKLYHSARSR